MAPIGSSGRRMPASTDVPKGPKKKPDLENKRIALKPTTLNPATQKIIHSGQEMVIDEKQKAYTVKTADIQSIHLLLPPCFPRLLARF